MTVALVAGSWSSNIGNAFYNLGAEWLLRNIGCEVSFFPESPRWKGDVPFHFDAVGRVGCELVVLNGPCLNERLPYVYRETFVRLYERGVRVGYLSAGMARYDTEESEKIGRLLEEFPPAFICTRDRQTTQLLSPKVDCPIYDGLCASMFLNDAIKPVPLIKDPYLVLNFDGEIEPEFTFSDQGAAVVTRKHTKNYPEFLLGRKVVRTSNLSIDEGYDKIYRKPNTYHSDLPQGYCSILKHADIVYSERVHTCAAALIYGAKAQFVRISDRSFEKRSQVFQRLGVAEIYERPVCLDFESIDLEKAQMRAFLKSLLT